MRVCILPSVKQEPDMEVSQMQMFQTSSFGLLQEPAKAEHPSCCTTPSSPSTFMSPVTMLGPFVSGYEYFNYINNFYCGWVQGSTN